MTFLTAFLLPGLSFGLAAGVSPGPLLTLVISETLSGGWRRGIRIALAPVLTDGPIVAIAILLLGITSKMDFFLGTISIAGALFLFYIGCQSIATRKGIDLSGIEKITTEKPSNRNALIKGIVTNYLNPAPYVFHFTVAAPIVARAFHEGNTSFGIIFLAGFFAAIVGIKIIIALVVDRSRSLLSGMVYVWLMRVLGAALIWFAFQNIISGISYLLKV